MGCIFNVAEKGVPFLEEAKTGGHTKVVLTDETIESPFKYMCVILNYLLLVILPVFFYLWNSNYS